MSWAKFIITPSFYEAQYPKQMSKNTSDSIIARSGCVNLCNCIVKKIFTIIATKALNINKSKRVNINN